MQSLLAPDFLALAGIAFLASTCALFLLARRMDRGLQEKAHAGQPRRLRVEGDREAPAADVPEAARTRKAST